jgi:hypothetical protein
VIRKLLVVAAAVAMPVGAFAAISAGTASASARAVSDKGTYICTGSGAVVTFQAPGLTVAGSVSEATFVTSKTSASVLSSGGTCGTVAGSVSANSVKSSTTACSTSTTPPLGSVCTAGDFAYGSWNNFINGGSSGLVTGLPHPKFHIDGDSFTGNTTTATSILPGGTCGASEAGFLISGTVNPLEGYTGYSLNVCFGNVVTGTNPGAAFLTQVNMATVASVALDPATTKLTVS